MDNFSLSTLSNVIKKSLILLIFLSVSCNSQTNAGSYCADVNYKNTKTGTSSHYVLKVEVDEFGKLTRMYFPNGGMLDNELNNADISDGKASVRLGSKVYDIKIKSKGDSCIENVEKATQCSGRTKKGKRCKNMTDDSSGKCHWHR